MSTVPYAFGLTWLVVVTTKAGAETAQTTTDPTSEAAPGFSLGSIRSGQEGFIQGLGPAVHTLSLESGATDGLRILGSRQEHDLGLVSIAYGRMLGGVEGDGRWYRGNWEIRAEVFGGEEFSPSSDWLIGVTPHLRYNFATGTRIIPFVDLGAGVTATGIGSPDLSGTFEFNLQANIGLHYFIRNNLALTFEAGYLHISCAGMHCPNLGLNTVKGMVGVTWFF